MDIVVEVLSQLETLTITKEALEVCSISAILQNTIIQLNSTELHHFNELHPMFIFFRPPD